MFTRVFLLLAVSIAIAGAFSPPVPIVGSRSKSSFSRTPTLLQAVVDVDSEAAFDNTIKSAGGSLVVVDYSTTWCGPCKVIAPKFDELSEKYPDAVFLKVRRWLTLSSRLTEWRYLKLINEEWDSSTRMSVTKGKS